MRACRICAFRWIPQGVRHSTSGLTIYDDDASVFFAEGSADYYLDDTARDAAVEKLAWVTSHVSGGRLLDVGANVGFFVTAAAGRFDATGIEPNVHAVRWASATLKAPMSVGSVYDDHAEFTGRFDAITLFDVIEHVPDARQALLQCREWLADDGRLFITTPDAGSVPARLLGRHWYYVDMNEHIALFSKDNLTALLEQAGFEVTSARTIGRRYRFSYIERRLAYLARTAPVMRLAHLAAQPLRLWPRGSIRLNLGDAIGVVARKRGGGSVRSGRERRSADD
jgi:cyclopropane fatty-acyl-phospholipid synthase-like methyltransferase